MYYKSMTVNELVVTRRQMKREIACRVGQAM